MNEADAHKTTQSFLHPAAGGLILGSDWLFFSATALTGGFALPAAMVLGFLSNLIGVTCIQRFLVKEGWGRALLKGFLAGVVVGLPFPIGGTVLGGAVLASSGLDQLRRRAARALAEGTAGKKAPERIEGE